MWAIKEFSYPKGFSPQAASHRASIVTIRPELRYKTARISCSFAVRAICSPPLITSARSKSISLFCNRNTADTSWHIAYAYFILWTSTDEFLRLLEEKNELWKWAFHDITPISRQLTQKLIYAILSNELSSGDSIPSVREMAEILHINPNTVLKSYKAVKQDHLIICSKGGKYSVTQDYDCIQQVKQNTIKELCCSYLSKMFALGFSKSEAIEQLQNYCDKLRCHQ